MGSASLGPGRVTGRHGAGVDIEQIADAVGHVSSTVTKAVYRRQIADEIMSAATAMDSIFGEARGSWAP